MDHPWLEPLISGGLKFLGAITALIVAWLLASRVQRRVVSVLDERSPIDDPTLHRLAGGAARWGLIGLGAIVAFSVLGVELAAMAALLGAAALTVGLAFQGQLSNLAAGVLILVIRPFAVGDVVECADEFGEVTEIGLLVSVIRTLDNKRVTLPNHKILAGEVLNRTARPWRRVEVPVGVAYGSDLHHVRRLLHAAADTVNHAEAKRAAEVVADAFGASSIDFRVRVWAPSRAWIDTTDRLVGAIDDALREGGVEIPFPQRDLHVRGLGEPTVDSNAPSVTPPTDTTGLDSP